MFEVGYVFPSITYKLNKPEFLSDAAAVHKEYVEKELKEVDPIYPIFQSSFMEDKRLFELTKYICQSAWNVLAEQGYDMEKYNTYLSEIWAQALFKHGQHIEHVHNLGAQISGFYFVKVPEDSSRIVIFDPKPAKKQIGLPQRDVKELTPSSDQINFIPKEGDLFLFNSWLGHGFTPNASDETFDFIHFNVSVMPNVSPSGQSSSCQTEAEVI